MGIVLGANQYGKAEVRLVHVDRSTPQHVLTDLNVSTHLRGRFADTYLTGDNSSVLATDTQKNTVYAFARKHGVGSPEAFALRLAAHFVESQAPVEGAQIEIDQLPWSRIEVGGQGHDHAFARPGGERRTTSVTRDGDRVWVVSGLTDLVVLKSTGSEFHGFPRDEYTTLPETTDRILATSVTARWRYASAELDFEEIYPQIRLLLLETFATTHSLALQQTLYAMGRAVLEKFGEVAEVRLSMPNKHHYLADLTPFGLDNPNQVFIAGDRPYGLIEGQVLREEAPDAGLAWEFVPGFI
ncbi:urate oxidase [Kineosporia rhizophila]|uniref:factor-independent urate hydroxylase n=1 Tax=Kineosporia TaxID=49184 RepID=UPI001E2BEAD3|nr:MULTISPECIES: urate oxidase [Kineosporia]MCE0540177.1 urate oxidase [Kineosporia rhizophila]GLY14320.1 uricase [Kineosporia sp. NBRC 101677]